MRKKRGKSSKTILIWFLFFSLIFSGLVYHKELFRMGYKVYHGYQYKYKPGHFRRGIVNYPKGYEVHGIDVSRWQDEIDWSKLKSKTSYGDTLQFQFAFIKATEGIWREDPLFKDNWKKAKKNKIIKGAYHYFLPDYDAKLQAANFISSVDLSSGDLPPVIDIEETRGRSKKEIVRKLKIFLMELEKKYKVKPIIYSNISFIEDYLADDFPTYKFWIAHYYEHKLRVDKDINWLFWQHNDRAGIFGCSYPVDVNVFNGSRKDLIKILVK